jgi:hypothetical protein
MTTAPWGAPKKDDAAHDIAAARQKLSEMTERPFDVDALVAQEHAKEEREHKVEHAAQEQLEKIIEKARRRRDDIRAKKVEKENQVLRESTERIEAEERRLQSRLKNTESSKGKTMPFRDGPGD